MFPKAPDGKLVNFQTIDDGWCLIKLEDGNYLRIKPVVTKVIRVNMTNPDGTPAYWFQTTNAVAVLTAVDVHNLYAKKDLDKLVE